MLQLILLEETKIDCEICGVDRSFNFGLTVLRQSSANSIRTCWCCVDKALNVSFWSF